MRRVNIYNTESNSNDNKVCGNCCVCSTALVLIIGAICFLVFGILFLVQDWDEYRSCSGSSLGPYVIVALVLSWSNGNAANSSKKEDSSIEFFFRILIYFLLNTGLAIWGGIELWEKSCDDLKDTNLWKFSLAIFILQIISVVILLLISLIFGCISVYESKNTNELPETTNIYTSSTEKDNTAHVV